VGTLCFAWCGRTVGADLRAARNGPSFRAARPEGGPYRSAAFLFCLRRKTRSADTEFLKGGASRVQKRPARRLVGVLVLRESWWTGRIAERSWREIWRMESARAFAPPPRGGGPPGGRWFVDCECGAEGKGGGGSTAGGPGCRLSHGPSAERLILLLALVEVVMGATADRSTPPVAAPVACLLPCIRFHSWPRHPPSEGGGACRPSCSLHSWNSRGGSTIIPEEPAFPSHMVVRSPRGGTRFCASTVKMAGETMDGGHTISENAPISHPAARLEAAPPEVARWLFRRACASHGAAESRTSGSGAEVHPQVGRGFRKCGILSTKKPAPENRDRLPPSGGWDGA
jgi:hypothetical protein